MARNTTIAQIVSRQDATDAKLDTLIGVVGDLAAAIRDGNSVAAPATHSQQMVIVRDGTGRATPTIAGARVVRRNAAGRLVDNKGKYVAEPKSASAVSAPIAVVQTKATPKAKAPKIVERVTTKAVCHPDRLAWTQKGLNCGPCREAVLARKAAKAAV